MVVILADQARHMTGGSDDVMEVMERNIPLDGSACSGSRTCKRSSSNMHRYGVLCGGRGGEVESRGCSKVCVDGSRCRHWFVLVCGKSRVQFCANNARET